MGIFSFIKDAGKKIFGIDKPKSTEAGTDDDLKKNEKAARKLEQTIKDLNLKAENLKIHIENDMAVVSGRALDQATREKIILVVGNSEGIAQVDDKMDVENTEPEAVFHTVERGDTLSKISKEHYGDPNQYPLIFEANKPMLQDPDKIYPGQVLRIPPMEANR
ncbi:peptidoglycan-binding protein LysM [Christiangramia forsetii]|uniref:Potassium binding protein Kbp n=2 Tax=Christiangramia forsetii TaxID=411153 RepID=A0M6X5_CHRFK|nr:peptidoglycan-binding protein LysM [Christiangramia forsetii]GGG29266.1 peptidoglycan-binding protein LysM [Christiangramia forsetii]CAL68370.1 peptidoglycan-binding LysM domain containing protein [Christiangramia forsetii KT0803]